MDFRVLGLVEARADGEAVPLGGPAQRRLLAALLLEAGHVVSVDRLVEVQWGVEEPPPDAPRTIRTYVSRLRAALGADSTAFELETVGSGYRLTLAAGSLDAARAQHLADEARVLLGSGDGTGATDLLRAALDEWTGPSLSEFADEAWAIPHASRLDELRTTIAEDHLEALLSMGLPAQAVTEAEHLVRSQPLRERPWRLLILGLHRSGRTAEALRAFQDYGALLATQTGLEPSEELRALEQRIAAGREPSDAAPGGRQLRSYRLSDRLGEGAFSIVWRGVQPSVGREVAVKQIRAELANRPEFIRRFEAEAQMVATLEHPYVVPLYDYWREPDSAYLVMRLLRGGTLDQRLVDGPMSVDEVATMVDQIGAALSASHAAGIVHRDVKPANVFLDGAGNYYLGDFGIALTDADWRDPEAALSAGSPVYAAPEQLRRQTLGPTADVHGLAITVYEALTGQLPFPGEQTQAGLLRRQLNDPIPPPSSVRPGLPRALDEVFARATKKDPAERYPTVDAFTTAFDAAVNGSVTRPAPARTQTMLGGAASNPFKGLHAFTEADAGEFFGRDRLVDRLVAQLCQSGPEGRLVAAVGPSGSGKSSVVRAGLVPALRRGRVPGSDRWFVTTMMPGDDPFGELEAALVRVAAQPVAGLAEEMAADPRGVSRAVKQVLPDDDSELLVIVDQFEELFTMVDDEAVRRRFLDGLHGAIVDARSRLRVVVTIRADFWDRPLRYAELAKVLETSAVTVGPLAPDELERAIVDPAIRAGAEFEPGLVSEIVADVADQPGALPQLQFTLTELFERNISGLLTIDAYRELGGVYGAMAGRAEEVHRSSTEAERTAMRRVFRRLVSPGEGSQDTRRRVQLSELTSDPPTAAVLDALGQARLLSFDRDETTREPTVELAHEAVIAGWARLGGWLDDDREGLRIHRHLTATASAWAERGRDESELYQGARLDHAAGWAAEHGDELNELERSFLAAGTVRRAAEVEREQQRARRLRGLLAGLAVIAAIALVATAVAVVQQRNAADERDAADAARLLAEEQTELAEQSASDSEAARADAAAQRDAAAAAQGEAETQRALAVQRALESDVARMVAQAANVQETDRHLALLLAAQANQLIGSALTDGALLRALVEAPAAWLGALSGRGGYTDVAFLDDGRVIAAGAGGVDVFDLDTGARQPIELAEGRTFLHMAPGRAIATAAGSSWHVLDAVSLTVVFEGTTDDAILAVALSADGRELALGHQDGTVSLVDLAGEGLGQVLRYDDDLAVQSLEWSPDTTRLLVTGGDSAFAAARIFDLETGEQVGADIVLDSNSGPNAVAWIDDVIIGVAGSAARFDATTGRPIGDEVFVRAIPTRDPIVALSDTEVLVLGNVTRLIDFEEMTNTTLFEDPQAPVPEGGALSSDGSRLVLAHADGLEVWSLQGERVLGRSMPGVGPVVGMNDAGTLVSSSFAEFTTPGPTLLYDAATGELVAEYPESGFGFFRGDALALLPDVRAPDPYTGRVVFTDTSEVVRVPRLPVAVTRGVSPDRRFYVVPSFGDRIVYVVELASGDVIAELDHFVDATPPELVAARVLPTLADAEFSPDSGRLVVASRAAGAAVWDTTTWELVSTHQGDDNFFDIGWTADGSLAVTVSPQGEVAVRDGATLEVMRGPVLAMSNTDAIGGKVASISDDGDLIVLAVGGGAQLVDGETLERIGDPIPHDNFWSVHHSPETDRVVTWTGGEERVITVWELDPSSWPELACRIAGRNMSLDEWEQFGPVDAPYEATCPQWPSPVT